MKKILFAFLLLFSLSSYGQDDIVLKDQQIPSFTVTGVNGTTISSSSLKGKVVLISFFATWCSPCISELQILQSKIWEKYKDNKNFIYLVIGRDHTIEEVETFKKKYNFTFPIYPDKGKIIYSLFANNSIPRNYLIDKNGKVVFKSTGLKNISIKIIDSKLKELLD